MARVSLDLENTDDLNVLQADGWRIAPGLVPGEPNQGLVAERRGSPPGSRTLMIPAGRWETSRSAAPLG